MALSPHEAMHSAMPSQVPDHSGPVVEVQDDLDRILALPWRDPVDCQRDPKTGLYSPRAEALVRLMTARLGRGPRVSCACRPRVVRGLGGGRVSVVRVVPEGLPPEPPRVVSVEDFVRDHRVGADEISAAQAVSRLRAGEEVRLPAGDAEEDEQGHFCIDTLSALQAWLLYEVVQEGGGVGFAGVGSGKSGCCILLATALGSECERAVCLIESKQRQHYRSEYRRFREHFRVPSIVFDDDSPPYIVPGAPVLRLLPYSKLGNVRHPDDLDEIDPNVVPCDEGHRLTGKANTTGRTRVRRFLARKIREREERIRAGLTVGRRAVYLVPMSGTLEDKSVEDTQPVSAHALGTGSPLPLSEVEAGRWGLVLDPVRGTPDRVSRTARRLQEAFAGGAWKGESVAELLLDGPEREVREGFCRRRNATPGVISGAAEDVGASLVFLLRKVPKMPDCVAAALKMVREEGVRPDGEPIVGDDQDDAAAMVKVVAKQVARGFFYYWAYPGVPCTCGGADPRCEGCLRISEWFARRKRYFKEARSRLLRALAHLDSPKLAANAARRAVEDASPPAGVEVYCVQCRTEWPVGGCRKSHLPAWRSTHWKSWAEIEDKVPHDQRVRWIGHDLPEASDPRTHPGYYVARDTATYATEGVGVVWYRSVAFGEKVAQLAGLPCHGGGPESEAAIRAETGKRSVVASLKSHGSGLNGLQYKFWRQLFPEYPSSDKLMEQCLGRLVRRGQQRDVVESEYYADTVEYREAIRKVRREAEFHRAVQGTRPLILSADFDE